MNIAYSRPFTHHCAVYAKPVSVLFVSSTLSNAFNQSADAMNDHSQSAKQADKFQLCGGPQSPNAGTCFIEWIEYQPSSSLEYVKLVGLVAQIIKSQIIACPSERKMAAIIRSFDGTK